MADLRVPGWDGIERPTIAVEPAAQGAAAIEQLARTARHGRWRASVSDDGLVVRATVPALAIAPSHLLREPKDLWRSSVVRAEASNDGVGGCRVEVEVEDRGARRLPVRTAELLSAWVADLEAAGTRVRTGMWRDAVDDAGGDPGAWTTEGTRLNAIADREAARTSPPASFALTDRAAAWADDVALRCGTADEPLRDLTARAWIDGLADAGLSRRRQPKPAYVVDALVGAAVADGVLTLPEPGVLRMAFARRDPQTESEDAWGWGLKPASTAALTWHAQNAVGLEELTTTAVGGAAVMAGLAAVVASLADLRQGPVDELRCW
ncbi:hypothetical protein GXB85_12835 [Cellulomonas sp. APG4]|uniref:hypothetical protein n=1 Tax=Cellulomonas sp. APG4 TaxID=1538656 RepID=UPI0013797DA2|nr:hypothetical protein [Cellulomonas sp. APG4]NCT91831.1 hypothetical protein [Cellulomonas sp. APG4]